MKLDIDDTIERLKVYADDIMKGNVSLGMRIPCIDDAIKAMKMWRCLKQRSKGATVYVKGFPASEQPLTKLCRDIEENFFPSKITQTVTIEIQGKDEEALCDTIQQVRLLYGVKDVRPHDSRY